jgi:hypothetical protein
MQTQSLVPYAVRVGRVFLLWPLYQVASGKTLAASMKELTGARALRKFQFFAWTAVVVLA